MGTNNHIFNSLKGGEIRNRGGLETALIGDPF